MKKKFEINQEMISATGKWFAKNWPVLAIAVICVATAILTFFALYPRLDPEYISSGMENVEKLNIRFDTKLLDELSATKQPSELKASGGRDPFAGY